jgi:hypothetical protein
MNAIKLWKALQGYKRHAGAIIVIIPVIAELFGLKLPDGLYEKILYAGSIIWGAGWVDLGARAVVTGVKGKSNE